MASRSPVVAIFDSNPDATELLRILVEQQGYVAITASLIDIRDGRTSVEGFMHEHRPDVLVYDITFPYDRNWAFLQHLRATPALQGVPLVLTTTNLRAVQEFVSGRVEIHELNSNLQPVIKAVERALGNREGSASV